jgi:hypothetical protein
LIPIRKHAKSKKRVDAGSFSVSAYF